MVSFLCTADRIHVFFTHFSLSLYLINVKNMKMTFADGSKWFSSSSRHQQQQSQEDPNKQDKDDDDKDKGA